MSKVLAVFVYIAAFFNVVVINCVKHPDNWKQCTTDLHVWLFPETGKSIKRLNGHGR